MVDIAAAAVATAAAAGEPHRDGCLLRRRQMILGGVSPTPAFLDPELRESILPATAKIVPCLKN